MCGRHVSLGGKRGSRRGGQCTCTQSCACRLSNLTAAINCRSSVPWAWGVGGWVQGKVCVWGGEGGRATGGYTVHAREAGGGGAPNAPADCVACMRSAVPHFRPPPPPFLCRRPPSACRPDPDQPHSNAAGCGGGPGRRAGRPAVLGGGTAAPAGATQQQYWCAGLPGCVLPLAPSQCMAVAGPTPAAIHAYVHSVRANARSVPLSKLLAAVSACMRGSRYGCGAVQWVGSGSGGFLPLSAWQCAMQPRLPWLSWTDGWMPPCMPPACPPTPPPHTHTHTPTPTHPLTPTHPQVQRAKAEVREVQAQIMQRHLSAQMTEQQAAAAAAAEAGEGQEGELGEESEEEESDEESDEEEGAGKDGEAGGQKAERVRPRKRRAASEGPEGTGKVSMRRTDLGARQPWRGVLGGWPPCLQPTACSLQAVQSARRCRQVGARNGRRPFPPDEAQSPQNTQNSSWVSPGARFGAAPKGRARACVCVWGGGGMPRIGASLWPCVPVALHLVHTALMDGCAEVGGTLSGKARQPPCCCCSQPTCRCCLACRGALPALTLAPTPPVTYT